MPERPPRIALAAGGTPGHVYPALAVGDEMRSRGWEVVLFGTRHGRELELTARHGNALLLVPGLPYHRTNAPGRAASLLTIPIAVAAAARWIVSRRIDAVIGFGGYASIGPVLAARLLGRWCAVVEPNVRAGKANRLLLPHVHAVYTGSDTEELRTPARVQRTGIPLRRQIQEKVPATRQDSSRTRLLVLGDEFLNDAVPAMLNQLAMDGVLFEVLHQGAGHAPYAAGISVRHETHLHEIWLDYLWSDVVICRAGAGTLAEVASLHRPAIVVPLKTAAENHQMENVRPWRDRRAALIVEEQEWTMPGVAQQIAAFVRDERVLAETANRACDFAVSGATARLVDDVAASLHSQRGRSEAVDSQPASDLASVPPVASERRSLP